MFALAEEFEARGHEAHVAMARTYLPLTKALPPRIRVHVTPEMYPLRLGRTGLVERFDEGLESDRANLAGSSALSDSDKRRRGARLREMVARDAALLDAVKPDVIITDYRFTPNLIKPPRPEPIFHISHLLGYPSFFRRVQGSLPFPLESGPLLVPGIVDIEDVRGQNCLLGAETRQYLCGPFRWRGWSRLARDLPLPPPSDVFLVFGSTGNADRIVPWLLRHLPERYRISAIASEKSARAPARRGVHVAKSGHLESFLRRTKVAFCHGGHGTVMECIRQRVPLAIFPQTIEQLEIGRRIETLRLGILVKRPYRELAEADLDELFERLQTDSRIETSLEKHARLLRRQDGAKCAASIVLRALAAPTPRRAALRAGRG